MNINIMCTQSGQQSGDQSGDESNSCNSSCCEAEAQVSSTTNTTIGSNVRIGTIFNKKCLNRGKWTKEEDNKLKAMVDSYGDHEWPTIAAHFVDRSDIQCQQRWDKVVNPKLVKGPWTRQVGVRGYRSMCMSICVYMSANRKTTK